MKNFGLSLLALSVLSAPVHAATLGLTDVTPSALEQAKVPAVLKPAPVPPVVPPGVTIAAYSTDEEFTFDSDAQEAMDARIEALKAAGITTLGGNIARKPNHRYSFTIDYIPTVKQGAQLPPAVIIETYKSGATYWNNSDNEEALNECAANFNAAGVTVLGSYAYKAGSNNTFAVDYLIKDSLRPTQSYDVKFGRYTGGMFTFESEAKDAVESYTSVFRQAGVIVTYGKAVRRADGKYAVQLEYPVRTNQFGPRPSLSIARYNSREPFTFDSDALAAAKERMGVFSGAGVPPVHGFAVKNGNKYTFSVDYVVRNIYQQGGAVPSAAVQTYQAQEIFTFESDARTAMEEKAAAFSAAGMPVVGSAVTGSLRNYTYSLDYITKAQAPAPHNF